VAIVLEHLAGHVARYVHDGLVAGAALGQIGNQGYVLSREDVRSRRRDLARLSMPS
jgi:hypothetical protein